MRATKIVCTVGPASEARLGELIAAGMDVARVNFSHGSPDSRRRAVVAVRDAAVAAGKPIAVLADLPGPKVRLGDIAGGRLRVDTGARFVLWPTTYRDAGAGADLGVSTTHPRLADDVRPGDRIFLSDGAVELEVVAAGDGHEEHGCVVTRVVRGGAIRSRAGVSVASERLSLPAVTDGDRAALAEAVELGVDLVAQSFVRSAADIGALRALMGAVLLPIVAKIETRSAVEDADEVFGAADAVMVARGDLGVQLPFEQVPIVQKVLVARAREVGIGCIVATQMLESMTAAPRPTRAEASDVANAVLEGTDAILLSAETAIGRFPVEAVAAAARIIEAAEAASWRPRVPIAHRSSDHPRDTPAARTTPSTSQPVTAEARASAIAGAAAGLARHLGDVTALACFTRSGKTAALLSTADPGVPVVAFSPDLGVVRRLALRRAVIPFLAEVPVDTDDLIRLVDERLQQEGLARHGDTVLVVAARRSASARRQGTDARRPADLLTLHVVGT